MKTKNMTMDEIVEMLLSKSIEKGWVNNNTDCIKDKKRVNILGLFWLEFCFRNISSNERLHGDIWTMNDYYRSLKWLKNVDMVFELHPYDTIKKLHDNPEHQNYSGDYLEIFKRDVKDLVVADVRMYQFFQRDIILLDYKNMHKKYPELNFSSTVDYMIINAVELGYESIYLYGIFLQSDHHRIHIKSLLNTINKARELGVDVFFDWENELKNYQCEDMLLTRYLDLFYKGDSNE